MARTQDELSGNVDEAEMRRQAFLSRINAAGGNTPYLDEGSVLDKTSPTTSYGASGSVLDNTAGGSSGARPSVLEQTEMGDSGLSSIAARGAALAAAADRANPNIPASRANRDNELDGPATGGTPGLFTPTGQHTYGAVGNNPSSGLRSARDENSRETIGNKVDRLGVLGTPSDEQVRTAAGILPLGEIPLLGGLLGKAGDLGGAIASRLGRDAPSALENANALAESAASKVGSTLGPAGENSFQLVGKGLPDAVESGSVIANRARGLRAGIREAAGNGGVVRSVEQFPSEVPIGQTLSENLSSLPGTLVKTGLAGAGVGALAGAGALAGGGNDQNADQSTNAEGQNVQPAAQPLPSTQGPSSYTGTAGTADTATGDGVTKPNVITPTTTGGKTLTPPPVGPGATTPRGSTDSLYQGINNAKVGANTGTTTGGGVTGPVGGTTTPTGPVTGPLPQGPINSSAIQQQVTADLNGIAQQLNAGPQTPDVMALFVAQGSKIIDMLNQQIASMQAEGQTVDPATQNTLDTLRQELDRQLKQTKEELNSRGLLDSGILVEAQQLLRKGNLSDQAKILAERLTRIQTNIQQLRGQQTTAASQFGLAGASAQTQAEEAERNRLATLKSTLVNGRLNLGGQIAGQEQAASQQAFTAQQNDLSRAAAFAGQQASLAAAANNQAAAQQFTAQQNELNRQAQAVRDAQSQAAQSARTNTSQAEIDLATNNVIAQLQGASPQDAQSAIAGSVGQPGFENVDWLKVSQSVKPKTGLFGFGG